MEIEGYIIQNQKGQYLNRNYLWMSLDNIQYAWVHPKINLEHILSQSKSEKWFSIPDKFTGAIYDTDVRDITIIPQKK